MRFIGSGAPQRAQRSRIGRNTLLCQMTSAATSAATGTRKTSGTAARAKNHATIQTTIRTEVRNKVACLFLPTTAAKRRWERCSAQRATIGTSIHRWRKKDTGIGGGV